MMPDTDSSRDAQWLRRARYLAWAGVALSAFLLVIVVITHKLVSGEATAPLLGLVVFGFAALRFRVREEKVRRRGSGKR